MTRRSFSFPYSGLFQPALVARSKHRDAGRLAGGASAKDAQTSPRVKFRSWQKPWLIFDCQTTGIDGGLRVIEIAAIGRGGKTLIDALINPQVHVPQTVTAVTGIDDAALAGAPAWEAIWPKLEILLLAQNHIIAWSAEFDLRALRGECARRNTLAWSAAVDARFVDLAQVTAAVTGHEYSFEEACALASIRAPRLEEQRAHRCCHAVLRIIRALGAHAHESL